MGADLHCHTKLSLSSMGIDNLIALAKNREINTIAITDRDCQAGAVRGKIIGERRGINVIPGVEISCTDTKRNEQAHILCYLSDSPDRLEGLCRHNTLATKKASQFMTLKIARKYPITPELVVQCATGSTSVFKQHIMHALMECGLTNEIYGELYEELFNPESPENIIVQAKYKEPAEVLEAIHEAGGIAVLAHPGKRSNIELIEELIPLGLDGIEVWHPSHTDQQVAELAAIAKKNGLLSIGGTDFRGMYSKGVRSVGDISTPDANVKALMSYKSKIKKRMAAAAK